MVEITNELSSVKKSLTIESMGFFATTDCLIKNDWKFYISPSHNNNKIRFYAKNAKTHIACGHININISWKPNTYYSLYNFERVEDFRSMIENVIDSLLHKSNIIFPYISTYKSMNKLEMLEVLNLKQEIKIPEKFTTEFLLDMILENEIEKSKASKKKLIKKKSAVIHDFERFKQTHQRVLEILAA